MAAFFFNDIGFYLTHRALHAHPFIYKHIHKQHHEYSGSIGLAAEYANPVESLISNIIPSLGGVILFGCHHPICVAIWLALRLQQTYFAHSGYCFRGTIIDFIGLGHSVGAAFHDHHHATNQGNYGSFFTDWCGNSMDAWLASGGLEGYLAKKKKIKAV